MKTHFPFILVFPKYYYAVISIIIITLFGSFYTSPDRQSESLRRYFVNGLNDLQRELNSLHKLCSEKSSIDNLQTQWLKAILQYKQLSVLIEYYNPYEVKLLNAPAISRVEPDNPKAVITPRGFQVIEELLNQNHIDSLHHLLEKELILAVNVIEKMKNDPDLVYKFKDETIFEAIRFSVIRLIALDITGFDSPNVNLAMSKAHASVLGIKNILRFYQSAVVSKDPEIHQRLDLLLNAMTADLASNDTFNSFDRIHFITKLGNPLLKLLQQVRDLLNINPVSGRSALRSNATSLFGDSVFNISFFSGDERYSITPQRVELGKLLFYDPILSFSKKRSCASCHKPELAFTDGLKVPLSIDENATLKRNTPTLWNTVFQTRQFYDSRTDFLENQLDEVVHNPGEMNGSLKNSVGDLRKNREYAIMFANAYTDQQESITPFTIANAISSYVRSLVAFNSRFDQFMNGDESKLSHKEKNGFNLFMGKARCATCHFIPLFNGLLPPQFEDSESEVLGVPLTKRNKTIDSDPGKSGFTEAETDKHSFKTPTLRNINLTAPYMHNGVFRTLRQVMKFYNDGGGLGSYGGPSNQTLLPNKLDLNEKECTEVILFMKTLMDTTYQYKY